MKTMTVTKARQSFPKLREAVQHEPLFLIKRGNLVMVLLSEEHYYGLVEAAKQGRPVQL